MLKPEELPTLSPEVRGMFFGGISLACEPCGETYAWLARQAAADRVVMLDPNIRGAFITDIERYRARLDEMIGLADIVKISDEDLHWIHPGTKSLEQKMDMLIAAGPSVVILTRGSAGATAVTRNGILVSVPTQQVRVADTVGAGDTFNAGFLARTLQRGFFEKELLRNITAEALRDAVAYGNRAAAIAVSRQCANPPWQSELSGPAKAKANVRREDLR